MQSSKPTNGSTHNGPLGIGVGLFMVLAGLLTLAEYAGMIPPTKWGLPIFGVVIGGVILYNAISKR